MRVHGEKRRSTHVHKHVHAYITTDNRNRIHPAPSPTRHHNEQSILVVLRSISVSTSHKQNHTLHFTWAFASDPDSHNVPKYKKETVPGPCGPSSSSRSWRHQSTTPQFWRKELVPASATFARPLRLYRYIVLQVAYFTASKATYLADGRRHSGR